METLLHVGGAYHIAFAVFHLGFWKLFRWREELARLGFINRGIVQILNLRLTYVFLAFAWLGFFHTDALLNSAIGRAVLAIIALFWLMRAAEQWYFFGWRKPVSLALLLVFLAGALLHVVPLLEMTKGQS